MNMIEIAKNPFKVGLSFRGLRPNKIFEAKMKVDNFFIYKFVPFLS